MLQLIKDLPLKEQEVFEKIKKGKHNFTGYNYNLKKKGRLKIEEALDGETFTMYCYTDPSGQTVYSYPEELKWCAHKYEPITKQEYLGRRDRCIEDLQNGD